MFNFFIIIFLALFLLLLILLVLPLQIHIYYDKKAKDDNFILQIRPPGGILEQKVVVPALKLRNKWQTLVLPVETELGNEKEIFNKEEKRIDFFADYQLLQATLQKIKEHILSCGHLARYLQLKKFDFFLHFGTDNPAYTGVIIGLLWGFLPTLWLKLFGQIKQKEKNPLIKITPCFTGQKMEIYLDSIFVLRIGHIMIILSCILLQEIKLFRKRKTTKKE